AAGRGLAAARAQATATAATAQRVHAAYATETTFVQQAIATQTAAAQATANAHATFAAVATALATTAYSAAIPGCPLGDPLWQTQNFDPANPNFVCTADGLQISTGARPHFGVMFGGGIRLAQNHDTQIHVFDIQPNVAEVYFSDGMVALAQHMDGSWQIFGPQGPLPSGTYSLPKEFTMRIRFDGSQATIWVNGITYATVTSDITGFASSGVSIEVLSRDYNQPSAIKVKDFAFTPLP
ncbi:MAG TPA: hypothetical protein VGR57_17485, partial [Ktedonobacterales bacterium]|nr:hypothetical protein [Ktedonobacterales bacterium]